MFNPFSLPFYACSWSRCRHRSVAGGQRGFCGRDEEDGGEEGAAAPLEALRALLPVVGDSPTQLDRVASALWRLLVKCKVVYISQQTVARKVADRASVVCPNNRQRLTFVGQDAVGWQQHAQHGVPNALMKTLYLARCPDTIFVRSHLFVDEGGILMCGISGLHRLQPVSVCGV